MGVVHRRAARVLPLTAEGAVLLLRCTNPSERAEPFWITVGGGLEPGETARQAAARELWEETGIVVGADELLGPVHSSSVSFRWDDDDVVQTQDHYVARVPPTSVSPAAPDPTEAASVLGHRWWTRAELESTDEVVLPDVRSAVEAGWALSDPGSP